MALNITTGQMRTKATLQKNTPVADGAGGFSDSYADICTFFGRMTQKKSARKSEQETIVHNQLYEYVTRAQDAITIDADSLLVIDGVQYLVDSWTLVQEIKHYFVMIISIYK